MRAGFAAIAMIVLALVWTGGIAHAQLTEADVIDTGPRNAQVDDALGWQRLQTKIRYLRPEAEFKPGEDVQVTVPPKPEVRDLESSETKMTTGIIVFIVVAIVIIIFVVYGNRINVSFGKTSEEKRSSVRRDAEGWAPEIADVPRHGLLDHLAGMDDRRKALILLTGHALERAADANGLKIARAQTARDVLRGLPRQWQHLDAMRKLVREAEVVHFGGRDLAEDTWQACLNAARPIFTGQGAAA